MTFKKTGDIAVAKVLCGCGAEIQGYTDKCPKCGKTILGIEPQAAKEEVPEENKEEVPEENKEEDKS